jgi:hypothetical protein
MRPQRQRLVFAYNVAAPHAVHCYNAEAWERGDRVPAVDVRRLVDEGLNNRNADQARDEAYVRAERYGALATVVRD